MFVEQLQPRVLYVCFNVFAIWRVVPYGVASSSLWVGGVVCGAVVCWLVYQVIVEVTASECAVVEGSSFVKSLLIA